MNETKERLLFVFFACATIFVGACDKEDPETNLEAFMNARQSGDSAFPCSQAIQLEILKNRVRSELVDGILTGWEPASATPEDAFLKVYDYRSRDEQILTFSQDVDNDGVPEHFFSFERTHADPENNGRSRTWIIVKKFENGKWRTMWLPAENFYSGLLFFENYSHLTFLKSEKFPNGTFVNYMAFEDLDVSEKMEKYPVQIVYFTPGRCWFYSVPAEKLREYLGLSLEEIHQKCKNITIKEIEIPK